MRYEKPEVRVLAEAVKAIEGSKSSFEVDGNLTTIAAYEADE